MNEKERALLPCGNCDAPARWVEIAWRVKCTRPSCGVVGGKFETQREAFAAWNTRAFATPSANCPVAGERHVAECNVFEGGRCNCVDGPHTVVDGNDEQPGDYLRSRLLNIANVCEAKALLVEASGLRDIANVVSEQMRKAFGAKEPI